MKRSYNKYDLLFMEKAYSNLKFYKKELVFGPLFKMFEVVFELTMPFLMAYIIDFGIDKAINLDDYTSIYVPGLIILGLCILGFFSTLICQYFASVASQGFGTKLRNTIYKKVLNLDLEQAEKIGSGSLTNLITTDVNRLQLSVAMMIRLVLRAPSIVIGSLICAFIINWKIAFIFLGVVALIAIIMSIIITFSSKQVLKVQVKLDEILTTTSDSLNGTRVIRAFNNEENEIKKYKTKTNAYFNEVRVSNLINALTNPLTYLIINAAIISIIYFSSPEIISASGMTKGELTSLISYLTQILTALVVVSNLIVIFTRAFASKNRVDKLLSIESKINKNGSYISKNPAKSQQIIKFENVFFKYNSAKNNTLENINFEINAGETVGIIGGTGSGKSTIIKLLDRLYVPSEGNIYYKGKEISEYNFAELKNEISIVNQKSVLLEGTISSNLKIENNSATKEEIEEALKQACTYDFVKNKKNELDEKVEEAGTNFSGGQKQRLAIARGILKGGEILILDDSTSALDYLTEKQLNENLKKLSNVTKIIISQRVSSLKNADKIIVMDHGKIDSIGKHSDLLKLSNIYKEIYESQVGEKL